MTTIAFLQLIGYRNVRQVQNGTWIGTARQFYTTGLFVGLDEHGYEIRYCYEHDADASAAAMTWDGLGDPPGPWIKRKGGLRGDRLGPGAHS